MRQTQPTTIQDVCSTSHCCQEEAWNLCLSGHFVVQDLWQRATAAWGLMRQALWTLCCIRRSRPCDWHWNHLKPLCEAAPSKVASLIVAHGTLGKAILVQVSCHTSKLVFCSQIYRLAKTNNLKDSISQTASENLYLSVSFQFGLFHKRRGIAGYCIGFTWRGILQNYGAWACLPCFLYISG